MTTHTPGPWGVAHNGVGYPMIHGSEATDPTTEARHRFIATLMPQPANLYRQGNERQTGTTEERDANARLIAAAPDMLEALQMAVDHIPSDVCSPYSEKHHAYLWVLGHVRAAIRAATA